MAQIRSKQIRLSADGDIIVGANNGTVGSILQRGSRKQLLGVNAAGTTLSYSSIRPDRTYFVTPNGDTSANGADGSINNPYVTIQEAVDNLPTDSNVNNVYVIKCDVGSYGNVDLTGIKSVSVAIEGEFGAKVGNFVWTPGNGAANELKMLRVRNLTMSSLNIAPTDTSAHTGLANSADFYDCVVDGNVSIKNVVSAGLYSSAVIGSNRSVRIDNVPTMVLIKNSSINAALNVNYIDEAAKPDIGGATLTYVVSEGSVITGNVNVFANASGTGTTFQLRNGNRIGSSESNSHVCGLNTNWIMYGSSTILGTLDTTGTVSSIDNTWFDNRATQLENSTVQSAIVELDHALTSQNLAKIFYVATNGKSAASGGDGHLRNPFSTIADALSASNNGDRIEVAPGTYNEAITFNKRVFVSSVGQGNNGDVVISDVSTVTSGVTFSGIRFINKVVVGPTSDSPVFIDTSHDVGSGNSIESTGSFTGTALFHDVNINAGNVVVNHTDGGTVRFVGQRKANVNFTLTSGNMSIENSPRIGNVSQSADTLTLQNIGTVGNITSTGGNINLIDVNLFVPGTGWSTLSLDSTNVVYMKEVAYNPATVLPAFTRSAYGTNAAEINVNYDADSYAAGGAGEGIDARSHFVAIDNKLTVIGGTIVGQGFRTIDAKGDLIVGTGDNEYTRLGVGVARELLRVNSAGDDIEYADITLAKTFFVSKSGNDSYGDGNVNNPYLTIGAAVAAATTGDRIFVTPGTYTEDLTFDKVVYLIGNGLDVNITGSNDNINVTADMYMSGVKTGTLSITGCSPVFDGTHHSSVNVYGTTNVDIKFRNLSISDGGGILVNNAGTGRVIIDGFDNPNVTTTLSAGILSLENVKRIGVITQSAGTLMGSDITESAGITSNGGTVILSNVSMYVPGTGWSTLAISSNSSYVFHNVSYNPTTTLNGTRLAMGEQARDIYFAPINSGNSVRDIASTNIQAAIAELTTEATFTYIASGSGAPSPTDGGNKGFTLGDIWANNSGSVWVCLNASSTNAKWVRIDQGPDANLFTYMGQIDARYRAPKVGDVDASGSLPTGATNGDVYQIITSGGDFGGTGPTVSVGDYIGFDGSGFVKLLSGVDMAPGSPEKGDYYKVIVEGTWFGASGNVKVGDGVVWNGFSWDKFDHTNTVVGSTENTLTVTGTTDIGFNLEVAVRFTTKTYTTQNSIPTSGDWTRSGNVVTIAGLDLTDNGVSSGMWVPEMGGIVVSVNGATVALSSVTLDSGNVRLDETVLGYVIEGNDEVTVRYAYRLA